MANVRAVRTSLNRVFAWVDANGAQTTIRYGQWSPITTAAETELAGAVSSWGLTFATLDESLLGPRTPAPTAPATSGTTTAVLAPVTALSVATVFKNATDAYNFPPRVRVVEPNRRAMWVRNDGPAPVQVGYSTGNAGNVNNPGSAAYNANPPIPPGELFAVEAGNTKSVFVRPVTSGNPVLVTVYADLEV